MIPITVFTPTYNRAHTLGRLYDSLRRQTCKDFEWLVIDDGSTDGTETLVKTWQSEESGFAIRYCYKENGGLHTAYNLAIEKTETELCVCIDSDDWMPDNAIERILTVWKENGSNQVAGIVGPDCFENGEVVGDLLPDQKTVNLIDLLVGRYPIHNGDRTNVVRTELYRQFAPMRMFPGEKNFNPHYMHLQISQSYDFLVLNEPLRIVEYQPNGMGANMFRQYKNSPNSFLETRKLYLSFPNTSLQFQLRHTVHFVSSAILSHRFCSEFRQSDRKPILILCFLPGLLLAAITQIKG